MPSTPDASRPNVHALIASPTIGASSDHVRDRFEYHTAEEEAHREIRFTYDVCSGYGSVLSRARMALASRLFVDDGEHPEIERIETLSGKLAALALLRAKTKVFVSDGSGVVSNWAPVVIEAASNGVSLCFRWTRVMDKDTDAEARLLPRRIEFCAPDEDHPLLVLSKTPSLRVVDYSPPADGRRFLSFDADAVLVDGCTCKLPDTSLHPSFKRQQFALKLWAA